MRRLVLNEQRLTALSKDLTISLPSLAPVRPAKNACRTCPGTRAAEQVPATTWAQVVASEQFAADMRRVKARAGVDALRVAVGELIRDF